MRLINDTCLKTRVGKDARAQGEGRNQIHLTRFLLAESTTQLHNRNPQTSFLQFVPSRLFHEFVAFFWKGRRTPYLRSSMNSAGRVTLFFLLITLITQGKFHCIQFINTLNECNNFEKVYLLCFSCAHWPQPYCDQAKESISLYAVSRELINKHALLSHQVYLRTFSQFPWCIF